MAKARRHPNERTKLPVNGRALGQLALMTARQAVPSSVLRKVEFPLRAPTVPAGVEPKRPESKLGNNYDTEWARSYPARAARVLLVEGVVRPAMDLLATPTVHGLDRLDGVEGPVIFAANHHSHVDTPLLLSQIPEPWRHHLAIGAAADYFFGTRVTATLSALVIGAIPIERTKVNRSSADQAAGLIDDGWSFLIFPEGGRSPDGWGQPFRGGAAYLSLRCGVPVVPVHLHGTGAILPKGKNVPKPGHVTITYGYPLSPADSDDSRKFAARIEHEVAALADEFSSDWYSARVRAHAGDTPALQGPGSEVGAWRRAWAQGAKGRNGRGLGGRSRRRAWPDI